MPRLRIRRASSAGCVQQDHAGCLHLMWVDRGSRPLYHHQPTRMVSAFRAPLALQKSRKTIELELRPRPRPPNVYCWPLNPKRAKLKKPIGPASAIIDDDNGIVVFRRHRALQGDSGAVGAGGAGGADGADGVEGAERLGGGRIGCRRYGQQQATKGGWVGCGRAPGEGSLARDKRAHRLDGSASREVPAQTAGRLAVDVPLLRHRQLLGLALFALRLGQRQRWRQALPLHLLGE